MERQTHDGGWKLLWLESGLSPVQGQICSVGLVGRDQIRGTSHTRWTRPWFMDISDVGKVRTNMVEVSTKRPGMFPLTFTKQSHLLVGWSDQGRGRLLEVPATGDHMLHTDPHRMRSLWRQRALFVSSPFLWAAGTQPITGSCCLPTHL